MNVHIALEVGRTSSSERVNASSELVGEPHTPVSCLASNARHITIIDTPSNETHAEKDRYIQ